MHHQPLKGVAPLQVAFKPSKRSSHDTGNASASTIRTQVAPRERSGWTELHCKVSQSQAPKAAIPVAKNTEANGGRATKRDDEGGQILLVRPTTSGRGHVATGRRARAVRLTSSLALRRLVGGKTSKLAGALVYKKGNVRPRVDEVDVHHELRLFKATFWTHCFTFNWVLNDPFNVSLSSTSSNKIKYRRGLSG